MAKGTWFQIARAGAFLSLLMFVADQGVARGGRGGGGGGFSRGGGGGGFGGGARGGASTSFGRGGGSGSFSSGARARGGNLSAGSTFGRGGSYSMPSSIGGNRVSSLPSSRPGAGGAATQGQFAQGTRPGQGGSGTRYQTGANNSRGNSNRVNNGNINTGDVNINGDWNGGCCGGWVDHPVAAGVAVGAVAGMTAAAIGSSYYALPPGCPPYPYGGYTYYSCGGAYYQPQYEGDTVVYVTVPNPAQGQPQ